MAGTQLYGAQLFPNAQFQAVVKRRNNAPGLPGGGGVDADTAGRIGYRNIDTGARVAGTNKGRIQGICCGITAGWIVALLNGNEHATEIDGFKEFFLGPLRFQGAYVKDFKPNSKSVEELYKSFGIEGRYNKTGRVVLNSDNINANLPDVPLWAGYVSSSRHAIGIGYRTYRYYVMEPNGGLFVYRNRDKMAADLKGCVLALKAATGGGAGAAAMKLDVFT